MRLKKEGADTKAEKALAANPSAVLEFQPSKRANESSASRSIHTTTERQTSPTTLRRCATSGSRPGVLSLSRPEPPHQAALYVREGRLLDVQWVTDHLESLGAVEVDRVDYLRLLSEALDLPAPDWSVLTAG